MGRGIGCLSGAWGSWVSAGEGGVARVCGGMGLTGRWDTGNREGRNWYTIQAD